MPIWFQPATYLLALFALIIIIKWAYRWGSAKVEAYKSWRRSAAQGKMAVLLRRAQQALEIIVARERPADPPSNGGDPPPNGADPSDGKALRQLADHVLALIGSEAEELDLEKNAFEFKVTKHKHFEWWVDFGVRIVLTAGAAWFTVSWFLYIKSIIAKIPQDKLSDAIVIALLTTTTANILGAWAIVARYVWNVKKTEPHDKEKSLAEGSDKDDKGYKIRKPKIDKDKDKDKAGGNDEGDDDEGGGDDGEEGSDNEGGGDGEEGDSGDDGDKTTAISEGL